ncbi:MAG: type II secretion system F family protein [Arachnia sp.]
MAAALAVGRTPADAWLSLAEDPRWGPAAKDLARSARSGTGIVETLQVHAEEMRLRADEQVMRRARAVGVSSVIPLMVCFLPAFVMVGVVPIIAGLMSHLLG